MSATIPSSQESAIPQTQPSLPITPNPAPAQLPGKDAQPTTTGSGPASLTPPPSSQHRIKFASPTPDAVPRSSSPPPSVSRLRDKLLGDDRSLGALPRRIDTMDADELRETVRQLLGVAHDAKTTAAHYKLQHQMSQMESGEAVERMAVEMEMARREIEVLQQTEAQAKFQERAQAPAEQTNFRQIHNDIYSAMIDELRDLKVQNAQLEHDLNRSRKIVAQQEGEIASLNDTVSLMRDRIRESRDQLLRGRKQSTVDATPRSQRTVAPFQTPTRERHATFETPRSQHRTQLEPHLQQLQDDQHQRQQQQQPGFAALLQATDIVSQGRGGPSGEHHRGHSRNSQSMSSLPSTPSRQPRVGPHVLYTPQPVRHIPLEVPMTAPVARKRTRDAYTPSPIPSRSYDSDGTVSAPDNDSEAETEVAESDGEDPARVEPPRRGPVVKRAKSAHNLKHSAQTTLYGPIRKANVSRDEPMPKGSVRSQEELARTGSDTGSYRLQRV